MKQKVMLICAFLIELNLYIIDEPFLGLDPIAINSLIELICDEKKEEKYFDVNTYFSYSRKIL